MQPGIEGVNHYYIYAVDRDFGPFFDRIHTFEHRPSQASLFPARRALVIRPDGACRSAQDPQMPPRFRAIAACATWGAISQT